MSRTGEFDSAGPLAGRTIAFLEARRSVEVARLVELQGGKPLVAPALRETPVADPAPLDAWLAELEREAFDVVMFLTGVGCESLLERARVRSQLDAALAGLAGARVIARGPKPLRVLKQQGVRVDFVPPEPNTSDELLAELGSWELRGKHLGLQIYGGVTPFLERLREGLASLGAIVHEVAPYRWEGPSDDSGVLALIDACVAGRVDAIAIFSSSQIHNLFAIADAHGRATELKQALNAPRLVVASIGPVASEAIESHDVHVDLQPEHPKMGHLVLAVATALGGKRG